MKLEEIRTQTINEAFASGDFASIQDRISWLEGYLKHVQELESLYTKRTRNIKDSEVAKAGYLRGPYPGFHLIDVANTWGRRKNQRQTTLWVNTEYVKKNPNFIPHVQKVFQKAQDYNLLASKIKREITKTKQLAAEEQLKKQQPKEIGKEIPEQNVSPSIFRPDLKFITNPYLNADRMKRYAGPVDGFPYFSKKDKLILIQLNNALRKAGAPELTTIYGGIRKDGVVVFVVMSNNKKVMWTKTTKTGSMVYFGRYEILGTSYFLSKPQQEQLDILQAQKHRMEVVK